MPHKAETNPPPPSISQQDICSGSAQLFPGGWNRWSGLVTLFSHCSRNLHHQAKLIIALDFAHQEKKDKLLSILCILTIFVTSQKEHFTLADAVLGGGCAMGLLCMGWKMPPVPKGGTNLVIAELTCTVTQTQSCDLSWHCSTTAWGRLRLLELCADLRCCCSTPDIWEVQNKKIILGF